MLNRRILIAGVAALAGAASPVAAAESNPKSPRELRVGVVAKSLGNGFFDAVHKGADEAGKELDAEVIFTGPTTPTAEGQIEVLNSLIAQRVDAIAVSANDPDALVPTLKRAHGSVASRWSPTIPRWRRRAASRIWRRLRISSSAKPSWR